jgi:hypothetical protein
MPAFTSLRRTSLKTAKKIRPTTSESAQRSSGTCTTPWLKIRTTIIESNCSFFTLGNRSTCCNLKTLMPLKMDILLDGHLSFEYRCLQVEAVIVRVRCDFEKNEHLNWEEVEAEGKRLFEEQNNLVDEFVVAPDMQQGECDDEAEDIDKDPAFNEHVGHQDFGVDLNIKTANNSMVKVVNLSRALVDDPTYFGLVRKLNVEQRLFFNHVMYLVHRAPEVQLKCFLTGGAGMGKSVLTSALFQSLTRWYNDQPEMDKSAMKVLGRL